ncbi:hypothetical protein D4R42_04460 [bacterium]|nr:MAG: hypothetical protein D4R42_04460 [bacterium]
MRLRDEQDPVTITRSVMMQAQEIGFDLIWDANDVNKAYDADQHIQLAQTLMAAEQLKELQRIAKAIK